MKIIAARNIVYNLFLLSYSSITPFVYSRIGSEEPRDIKTFSDTEHGAKQRSHNTETSGSDTGLGTDLSDVSGKMNNVTIASQFNGNTNHIIGGKAVPYNPYINRYPYMVSIRHLQQNFHGKGYYKHGCGGTLVAPDVVLTAAHCITKEKMYVHIGNYFRDQADKNVDFFYVEEVRICPDFLFETFDCDVALLKLSRRSSQEPVRLLQNPDLIEHEVDLTVIGWGTTSPYKVLPSSELRETDVSFLDDKICEYVYPEFTDTMFCAYARNKDACQGDSGGPIILKNESPSRDFQVGIVSWGLGCATTNPGVYTSMLSSRVQAFIHPTICELSPSICKGNVYKSNSDENKCKDFYGEFQDDRGRKGTCNWVKNKQWRRCQHFSDFCPNVCCPGQCIPNTGKCPDNYFD